MIMEYILLCVIYDVKFVTHLKLLLMQKKHLNFKVYLVTGFYVKNIYTNQQTEGC